MELNIRLTLEEVNGILNTLGNLPTSSGAWPLLLTIKAQAEHQIAEQNRPKAAASENVEADEEQAAA